MGHIYKRSRSTCAFSWPWRLCSPDYQPSCSRFKAFSEARGSCSIVFKSSTEHWNLEAVGRCHNPLSPSACPCFISYSICCLEMDLGNLIASGWKEIRHLDQNIFSHSFCLPDSSPYSQCSILLIHICKGWHVYGFIVRSEDINTSSRYCSSRQVLIGSMSSGLKLFKCALQCNACLERFILNAVLWPTANVLFFIRRYLSSDNILAQREVYRLWH